MNHLGAMASGNMIYSLIAAAYFATIVSCVVVVLRENRNPIRSISWVVALIFLPVAGLVFYLFFGRSLKGLHMVSRSGRRRLLHDRRPMKVDMDSLDLSPQSRQLVKLANSVGHSPMTLDNNIEIFIDGRSKFTVLERDLRGARKSIYIEYYIIEDDVIGNRIADILIEKAREGLDVKLLYDHVGSFSAKNSFFNRMRQAGVETHPFFKVTFPQLANRINWRNHRKIVVIDGAIGYIGGMNIADRYAGGAAGEKPWRDTHFRVTGGIISSLLYSFAVDWNFQNPSATLINLETAENPLKNNTGIQLVTCGPNGEWDNLSLCFLQAISNAKRSIFIQTPYFLPTDTLLHALELASLSKVDVRIMIPRECDSRMLQYASRSYVTRCLKAGIKVYEYLPGMIHSKTMTVDTEFSTGGSTNFDFRSFENNFECNLLIYDSEVNREMRDIFFSDLRHCRKIVWNEWRKRPLWQRGLESIIRLFSPIL
jgi:hypothetical protein